MEQNYSSKEFQYIYSAEEQEEIKKIRDKYLPQEEDKMTQLRKLDAGVSRNASVHALSIGMIGALILGIGMCCCMVWKGIWFVPGIVIGLAGMVAAGMAYPAYQRILKKERAKIAPEIIRLTEELMK